MKLSFFVFSLVFPVMALANSEMVPFPESGLQIIPLEKMNIPESFKQAMLARKAEEKVKGYHETDTTLPRQLLLMKRNAPTEINSFKKNHDPLDTHLKSRISEIKLAFPFKELSTINKNDVLGYAPLGTFIQDSDHGGWSGIKVFFTEKELGTCAYSFFNLAISHGAIQLNTETTQYIINKKPSSTSVEGNHNSGFIYNINWFDPTNMHALECANMTYSEVILDKMISFASLIDKQVTENG